MSGVLRKRCTSDAAVSTDSEGAATNEATNSGLSVRSSSTCSSFAFSPPNHHSPLLPSAPARSGETGLSNSLRKSMGNLFQSSGSLSSDHRRGSQSSLTGSHSRHRSVDFALASIVPDLTETIDTDFSNATRFVRLFSDIWFSFTLVCRCQLEWITLSLHTMLFVGHFQTSCLF